MLARLTVDPSASTAPVKRSVDFHRARGRHDSGARMLARSQCNTVQSQLGTVKPCGREVRARSEWRVQLDWNGQREFAMCRRSNMHSPRLRQSCCPSLQLLLVEGDRVFECIARA